MDYLLKKNFLSYILSNSYAGPAPPWITPIDVLKKNNAIGTKAVSKASQLFGWTDESQALGAP